MMGCLHKDIVAIINRYIFDYNYSALRVQYRAVWLNPEYSRSGIYWCPERCIFVTRYFLKANYRVLLFHNSKIRRFYDDRANGAPLPKNY